MSDVGRDVQDLMRLMQEACERDMPNIPESEPSSGIDPRLYRAYLSDFLHRAAQPAGAGQGEEE